jgi:protein TonB
MARRARVTGKVILQAVINERGDVVDVKVLKSHPLLDDSAISAVKRWKYKPATLEGKPVAVYFTVVVNFTLD